MASDLNRWAKQFLTMIVKDAVQKAKDYAKDFFAEESVSPFQLEEVIFDDSHDVWEITLGYYVKDARPLSGLAETMSHMQGDRRYERKYKVFRISDSDGSFLSMKIREAQK